MVVSALHTIQLSMQVRSSYVCPVFGTLCDFMDNHTYEDILKYLLLNKKKLKNESGRNPTVEEIIRSVMVRVQSVYDNASLISVGKDRCNNLIFDYHSKYMILERSYKSVNSSQE